MLNINKSKVNLPTSYSKNNYTFNSSGDVIIPDSKEDVSNILFVDCIPSIDDTMINSGQITITGNAEFNIIYASDNEEQKIIRISTSIPFKSSFEVPSLNSDSNIDLSILPDIIDSKILNGRKISLNATINVAVVSFNNSETEFIEDVNSDENIQILKESKSVLTFLGKDKTNTTVKDTVMLPTSLPNIKDIIKYESKVINEENIISDDKVIFKGELFIRIYYCSENDDKLTCFDSTVSFSDFANINDVNPDSLINMKSKVNNISLKVLPDSDELMRVIEFDAQISTVICAFNNENINVINDLYCTQKIIEPQKNNITYDIINGNSVEDISLRGVINIPENETISIIATFGRIKNISIEEQDGKNMLTGSIDITIIYRLSSNNSINSASVDMPMEHIINSSINHVNSATITGIDSNQSEIGKFDIKISLNFCGTEIKSENISLLSDISETDSVPEKKSSLTVYYAKPGDSYWKIAKKFNTTVENIRELNSLTDTDKLLIGTPIII